VRHRDEVICSNASIGENLPSHVHLLSDDRLRNIGYRLICSVFAEYEWDKLRRDSDPDVLDNFLAGSDSEISELLVSLASLARVTDDARDTLGIASTVFPHGVGALRSRGQDQPLTPREACNKVLHSESVRWHFDTQERNPLYEHYYQAVGLNFKGTFKAPRAVLAGRLHREEWEANLLVIPFVIATANWDVAQWRFA
jgi:hypothetical protein